MLQFTKAYVLDLVERAANTFWQGALGAAAPLLLAADATHSFSASFWQQVGAIAFAGGLAALGSMLKSLIAGGLTGTASVSKTVAQTAVVQTAAHDDTISDADFATDPMVKTPATVDVAPVAPAVPTQATGPTVLPSPPT